MRLTITQSISSNYIAFTLILASFNEQKNQATIKRQNATIESMKNQLESRGELESKFDECVEELGRIQSEKEVSRK